MHKESFVENKACSVVSRDRMIMRKIASTQIPTSLQCWCVNPSYVQDLGAVSVQCQAFLMKNDFLDSE